MSNIKHFKTNTINKTASLDAFSLKLLLSSLCGKNNRSVIKSNYSYAQAQLPALQKTGIFESIAYKRGVFEYQLKDSYSQSKGKKVRINVDKFLQINSKYAQRLFFLLAQNQAKGNVVRSTHQLRTALGVSNDSCYKKFKNFKKLIQRAISELKTAKYFHFSKIELTSKKLYVAFKVRRKVFVFGKTYTFESSEKKELFDTICDLGVAPKEVNKAVRVLDPDLIRALITRSESKNVLNQANYLYRILSIKCESHFEAKEEAEAQVFKAEADAPMDDDSYYLPLTLNK